MPHHLASALYKLVYGNARLKNSPELKRVEGVKAFFVNDPSRSWYEIKELSEIDRDMSGTIDQYELLETAPKAGTSGLWRQTDGALYHSSQYVS